MFWKFLKCVNDTEVKFKKLNEVTRRIIILALSIIVFLMLISSGFLSAVGTFIMFLVILYLSASLSNHILRDTKQNGDH